MALHGGHQGPAKRVITTGHRACHFQCQLSSLFIAKVILIISSVPIARPLGACPIPTRVIWSAYIALFVLASNQFISLCLSDCPGWIFIIYDDWVGSVVEFGVVGVGERGEGGVSDRERWMWGGDMWSRMVDHHGPDVYASFSSWMTCPEHYCINIHWPVWRVSFGVEGKDDALLCT